MELGEHPAVTALRELGEELGSTCVFGELTILKSFPYISTVFEEGKHHITLFFETVLKSGQPRVVEPDKCDRWEWFEPDNLPSPLFGNLAIVDFR